MRTIKVAAIAADDINGIWAYIAEHNPEAASRIVKEIVGRFVVLRDYPQMGREQDRLLLNLRSVTVKGYIIFYQPFEDGVEILRVLHGARDVERIFKSFLDSL